MKYFSLGVLSLSLTAAATTCDVVNRWGLWQNSTALRGANVWQKVLGPEDGGSLGHGIIGPGFSMENLSELRKKNANTINLSVPGPADPTPPYRFRKDVLDALERLVDQALAADLFVVISFRTGPGRDERGFDGSPNAIHEVWKSAPAQGRWEGMWSEVAQRFQSHPAVVAYDLMVEPNANDVWLKLWDPTHFYPKFAGTLYDWNPMAAQLVAAIREVDLQTPIVVGAMDHSSSDWFRGLKPISSSKIVYAVHQYAPHLYTHQKPEAGLRYPGRFDADGDGNKETVDVQWLREQIAPAREFALKHQVPVVANEFGVKRWAPGAPQFLRDQMKVFEDEGWNHALWLWESDHPGVDWDDFDVRKGPDPNHHKDVSSSQLLEAIRGNWQSNRCWPSNSPWLHPMPLVHRRRRQ